ncbi:MAG: hypothetical protein AB1571_01820 [Nanoarchaeota archaeon]
MADTRTLFLMVLLIVGTGILFTKMFPYATYTGKATISNVEKSDKVSKVYINPNVIANGQEVIITVKPGSNGLHKTLKFCKTSGLCIDKTSIWCKENYKCFDKTSFNYIIPNNWPSGNYVLKGYDYYIDDYVTMPFELQNLSEDAAPKERLAMGPIKVR